MKKTIVILIVALLSFSCEVKVAEKPQRKEKSNTGGNISPNSATHIGAGAFSSNKLTRVTIPEGVTHIGANAFSGSKLTSVTLPDSVTHIGEYAFYDNKLTTVVMSTVLYNKLKDAKTLSKIFSNHEKITFTDYKGNAISS